MASDFSFSMSSCRRIIRALVRGDHFCKKPSARTDDALQAQWSSVACLRRRVP